MASGFRSVATRAVALTDQTLEIADFEKGTSQSISVGTDLTGMQALPDGTLIVFGREADSQTAWLVDPSAGSVAPIDLSGGSDEPVLWSQVAIDGNGYGVAVEQASSGSVEIRVIDASDPSNGVQSSSGYELVPADTQVITSTTGGRSVLAWSGPDGLELSLWSNSTGTLISGGRSVLTPAAWSLSTTPRVYLLCEATLEVSACMMPTRTLPQSCHFPM